MATTIPGFGWRPSLPDFRDLMLEAEVNLSAITIPRHVTHRGLMPRAWDQGRLGSCTAFSTCAAYMAAAKLQGFFAIEPSRLFVYYMTRGLEGTISHDSGASNRNAVKSLAKYGAPPETLWPYNTARFRIKPTAKAQSAGLQRQALEYLSVRPSQLQVALAGGFPVVIGFSVYQSFQSATVGRTGMVPLPRRGEKQVGGHSVLLTGYDMDHPTHRWEFLNSYSTGWGDGGYGRLPEEYLINPQLSGDFWAVRKVEG